MNRELHAGVEVRCPNCRAWHTAAQRNADSGTPYERNMLYVVCGADETKWTSKSKLFYIGQIGQQSRHEIKDGAHV